MGTVDILTLEQRWACNVLLTLIVLHPFDNSMDIHIGIRKWLLRKGLLYLLYNKTMTVKGYNNVKNGS